MFIDDHGGAISIVMAIPLYSIPCSIHVSFCLLCIFTLVTLSLVINCSVLLCSVLLCSALLCSALFCSVLFYINVLTNGLVTCNSRYIVGWLNNAINVFKTCKEDNFQQNNWKHNDPEYNLNFIHVRGVGFWCLLVLKRSHVY